MYKGKKGDNAAECDCLSPATASSSLLAVMVVALGVGGIERSFWVLRGAYGFGF